MRTTTHRASERRLLAACGLALMGSACGGDDTSILHGQRGDVVVPEGNGTIERDADLDPELPGSAIVVLSRVCGPDACQSYLKTYPSLAAMEAEGTLDRTTGVEIPYSQGRVFDGAIYTFDRQQPTITRWTVEPDLSLTRGGTVSFAATGTSVFCEICNVFVRPDLAFHVDGFAGGVIVAWNPTTMELIATSELPESILERNPGISPEIVFPVVSGNRAFFNASWVDFDSLEIDASAALMAVDGTSATPRVSLLTDDRCGGTYSMVPFAGDDGSVYAIGEWRAGYWQAGIPEQPRPPACLLRVKPGEDRFDPDFYVDLLAATGAKAIRNAYAMGDGMMLLNILPEDAPGVTSAMFEQDPTVYWTLTEFTHTILLDLETLEVQPVTSLPPAGAGSSERLVLDDRTLVQVYPEGRPAGSTLLEVRRDGTTRELMRAGSGADFSTIGRVR